MRRTLTFLASGAMVAAAVAAAAPAQAAESIPGGGASFPYPFLSQCAADFNAAQGNFQITYTSTGSGTGKTNFTNGQFVYAQSDSAFAAGTAPTKFTWTYVPDVGGAIALPINLKNAKTNISLGSSIQLTQQLVSQIWSGQVKTWNDPAIVKVNPRIASALPATPITIVYRSGTSGTTNNFLQYLNAWDPSTWTKVQDDMSTAFPGGAPSANSLSGKDNATIIATVNNTPGAIGYVDFSDAKGYPVARVQNASGEFIAPSAATAAKNLGTQTNIDSDGLVHLNYKSTVKGAYPIAIFSYGLARTYAGSPNGLGVRQFFDYVLQKCGPSRAAQLGYVPVTGDVLAKAKQLVTKIQ